MKKFAIKTLGCKVNQYEEQVIRESLSRFGFIETEISGADVFIVNSCTVTAKADSKTRKLIRQAKKENPKVTVLVTGCYVVVEEDIKELLSLPEVDIVVPGSEKMKIALALESNFDFGNMKEKIREEVTYFEGHTRAFLKVQDGCDQRCSYCKV
ncbi:MAG: tRNA (N(6)-L-threonylcarbamoyladenosine(37)-C(2))-methylthiotransferase MtaB, partial [Candidatus Omnitrophica bacterium]|nr:tRNA (N(6)-L-threonylcarbamoyladenosine(37)-C(2))-methylthiotransferase MtaB [Candidatus Omnitrophota bacterium]